MPHPDASRDHHEPVNFVVSFLLVVAAIVTAVVLRQRTAQGRMGSVKAYDRPANDWLAIAVVAAGGAIAAFVAGVAWLGWAFVVSAFLCGACVWRAFRFG